MDFISLAVVVAAGHVASGGDVVPCSLRALLEGRRECAKHSLLGSQVTSGCFVMLAENSDVFPSSPKDEQLYLWFFWCVQNRKKNRKKVTIL